MNIIDNIIQLIKNIHENERIHNDTILLHHVPNTIKKLNIKPGDRILYKKTHDCIVERIVMVTDWDDKKIQNSYEIIIRENNNTMHHLSYTDLQKYT